MSLSRGAADFLDVTNPNNYQLSVLREYLHLQGDRTVHFSGFCCELASTPIVDSIQRKVLSWSPLQRTLIVTSHALMYIPRTTEQSGIFFDCRVPLDSIAQVIVLDSDEFGKVAQIYVKTKNAPTSLSAASPFPNLVFAGQELAASLTFEEPSVRKSFLMALCAVRPQLPILQKKVVDSAVSHRIDPIASSSKSPVQRDTRSLANYDIYHSPGPKTPASARGPKPSTPLSATNRRFPQAKSFGTLAAYAKLASSSPPTHNTSITDPLNITEEEFKEAQIKLQEELLLSTADAIDEYDAEKAASRAPEEDPSRKEEREEIRAMLETRERKMCQHIEFRMKYPTKVPTRVQPGVEFDKAHEERRVLPDDHTDEDLLGPSLAPLWWRWKRNGGLEGLSKRSGVPDGAANADEWNVFDSAELIDSLKAREEIVYGQVGPKSQARLQRMRELVQRELHMHKNRLVGAMGQKSIFGKGESSRQTTITVPVPFTLSQSPVTLRRMKMVDSDKLITELRQSFDKHQQAVHQIRKAQLQREVHRAQGGE